MLKLNTSGGKLDITFTDDQKPFGAEKRVEVKHPPREAAASRTSLHQGKQSSLSTRTQKTGRGIKGRERRQASTQSKPKPVNKEHGTTRQGKVISREKKGIEREPVTNSRTRAGESDGLRSAGVLTQGQLVDILSLIKSGQPEASTLTREQIADLIASVGVSSPPHQPVSNQDARHQNLQLSSQRTDQEATRQLEAGPANQLETTPEIDRKQQWRKELDEQVALAKVKKDQEYQKTKQMHEKIEEYNPWGRPGAGAPIRTQSGNVLADYHIMAKGQLSSSRTIETSPLGTVGSALPSHYPPRTTPTVTIGSSTGDMGTSLPAAMRSSFAIGAPGLVAHETQLNKGQEHRRWKEDIERQIAEKKERDRQQKSKEQQEDLANATWARHLEQYRSPPKNTAPQHQVEVGAANGITHASNINPSFQLQAAQPQVPQSTNLSTARGTGGIPVNAPLDESFKTHARGYGMHSMDPQTQDEMEKKRQKILEHQRAIQEQVEEKRRLKQQEKEKRMQEEAVEEARLTRERDNLNRQFALELQKQKEKEEEAKRRGQALQQSVLEAYQLAQQVKREKRRKHLEAGGHDTSGMKSRAGEASTRSYVISQGPSLADKPVASDSRIALGSVAESYDKTNIASKESPRKTEFGTSRNYMDSAVGSYDSHSSVRYKSDGDSTVIVPPLYFTRGDSPPIPTLRNKTIRKSPRAKSPTSSRSTSRGAKSPSTRRRANLSRTTSSHSEPSGGQKLPSSRVANKRTRVDHIATPTPREETASSRVLTEDAVRPFTPIEDAFVIPYHRTHSATLPVPPDTPLSLSSNNKRKGAQGTIGKGQVKVIPPGDGTGITPMYRTPTTQFKDDKTHAEISPRKVRGAASVTAAQRRQQNSIPQKSSKTSLTSRGPTKKPSKENFVPERKPSNSQLKSRQERPARGRVTPGQDGSPPMDVPYDVPQLLPTPRQEMILQQLKALRQGLMIKERELQQEML